MFTGIIEEIGTIDNINKISERAIQLTIEASKVLEDIQIGDSIAVNGICLTVTTFTPDHFQVDVMPETMTATSLVNLKKGSHVNLERSMPANGRFGGHFVSGHVDCTGKITMKKYEENAIYYTIEMDKKYHKFLLYKGSVAVDGISLTVFSNSEDALTISLIPHTAEETILGEKVVGDLVNLEFDMLGKYVYQMLTHRETDEQSKINESFLTANGFI